MSAREPAERVLASDGTPKEDWWEPPPLYSDMPRLEAPDLWHLVGPAAFVITEKTAGLLGKFLHPVGELLPVRVAGATEPFVVLNILRVIDCLNPDEKCRSLTSFASST